ncbi:MAG: Rrf2 family transcriptional regulator [Bacteroidota bacterium]
MVLLSKASLYGIKAAIYLAKQAKGEYIAISKISKDTDIPFHYLTKILQEMRKKELICSSKGINGGVFLAKSPDEISLYQIIIAIDKQKSRTRDYLELNEAEEFIHSSLNSIFIKIENYINTLLIQKTLDKCIPNINLDKQFLDIQ